MLSVSYLFRSCFFFYFPLLSPSFFLTPRSFSWEFRARTLLKILTGYRAERIEIYFHRTFNPFLCRGPSISTKHFLREISNLFSRSSRVIENFQTSRFGLGLLSTQIRERSRLIMSRGGRMRTKKEREINSRNKKFEKK